MNYKILTIITLAALAIGAVMVVSDADESNADGAYNNWVYQIDGDSATILWLLTGPIDNAEIPSSIVDNGTTYPVTIIGNGTDNVLKNSNLNANATLTIPDSVTSISQNAFRSCKKLISIDLGVGVQSIEQYAFSGCSGLTGTLAIPDSVTSIGQNAFNGCSGFTGLTIPDSVTSISDEAFYQCSGFTGTLAIPDSITSIGSLTFGLCSGFTGLTIPDSVTSIGQNAFNGCSNLTSVDIPDTVLTIGQNAFYGCNSVTELIIRGTPTDIYTDAFNMTALETVYNLGSNESIVAGAYGIPATATVLRTMQTFTYAIADGAATITGTTGDGWESVEIPSTVTDGGVDYPVTTIGSGSPIISNAQLASGATLTIPSGITAIARQAFQGVNLSGALVIPDTVTSIGYSAFYQSRGFTSLDLGDGVVTIGDLAFYNTNIAGALVIPDTVTSIGGNAFDSLTGLTSLDLGAGVVTIGESAFNGCTGLTGALVIPDTTQTIGKQAFRQCGFTSLDIGDGVQSIGQSAFSGCTGLTGALVIPDSMQTIGNSAFYGCTGLSSLDLGAGVVTIGNSAFYGGAYDGALIIPVSVSSIGTGAFEGCANLDSLVLIASPAIGAGAFTDTGIKEVLNLSAAEITTTSYGLNADEVRSDVPDYGVIAPAVVTETVNNEGAMYELIKVLPILIVASLVLMVVAYAVRSRLA